MSDYKVVLKGHFDSGDQTRNIFYFNVIAAGNMDMTLIHTYLDTIFHAGMLSGITNQWRTDAFTQYKWENGYWNFVDEYTYDVVGAGGTTPDIQQAAYVLVARTAVKRVVPKKFFAGVLTAAHTRGSIMPATLAALNTAATAWKTGYTDNGQPVTCGTFTKNHTFTALLAAKADAYIGTQRRRKQGVGF